MANRKNQNSLNVGRDVDGSIIQVGDNSTTNIHNNIDGEELGQSLGETLSEATSRARWEERIRESYQEDTRQVMGTIFISMVSGLGVGASWKLAFPWNAEIVPFFVIVITVLFNLIGLTNFGVRRSIFKIILLSGGYWLMLTNTSVIRTWMDTNQFVGASILATFGALSGLIIAVIQMFWHPLED